MRKFICIFSLLFISSIYFGQIVASAQSNESKPNVAIAKENLQQSPVEVPVPTQKALDYYYEEIGWWLVYSFWDVLIAFLFLQTKASAKIRDFVQKISGRWYLAVAIYFTIFLIINFLLSFPLYYYAGFVREHDYGLSTQTFYDWLTKPTVTLIFNIILSFLLLWIPYLLLRKSPKRWWFYVSLLMIPFFSLVMLIVPIFIDPLVENFSELKNKELEAKVLQLADRAGIEGIQIYEVEKSADTTKMNAYVVGIFNTKRIVLWDTIIKGMDEDELLFVVAHEMGHYVLGHSVKKVIFFSILAFLFLFVVYKISTILTTRFGKHWGFSELSDPAAMPLLILVFYMLLFVFSPLGLWNSRSNEHEADRFALEFSRNNRACGTAFVKTQTENLIDPRPSLFIKIINSRHPPIGERIDFCNEYKPWEKGEPLQYGGLFKEKQKKSKKN
jgi:STE24 endopeptidase